VLIEKSEVADAKMRSFNRDGSEGKMAGNNIRCVGKFLYDEGYVRREAITVETASGIKKLHLFLRDGKVTSVSVDMGKAEFATELIPVKSTMDKMINVPMVVADRSYNVTCLSIGNPHCVVFTDSLEEINLERIGPQFEYDEAFPERVNTEFVRYVNPTTLRVRVWERGNGETQACGTGACAAAIAAIENGMCSEDTDINVELPGGDLIVHYKDGNVSLTGSAIEVFDGTFEF